MATAYCFGVNTTKVGTFAVVVGGTVGSGTATVAGTLALLQIPAANGGTLYSKIETVLAAALEAAVPAGAWNVQWSPTTYLFTISCDIAFTLTWTGDAGTNLRRMLGFASAATTLGLSAVGTIRPYYLIVSEIAGRSDFSDVYEPAEIATEAVSDGGDAFSTSNDTDELWCDWVQQVEPKAAVLSRSATSAIPWTWQHAWKHARADVPFIYIDIPTVAQVVYKLRAEGASFRPDPVEADVDTLWNLKLECRDLGAL